VDVAAPILDDLIERYRAGESVLALSRESGVSRWTLTTQLVDAGVEIRSLREAARLRAGRPAGAVPLIRRCGGARDQP
jgi:AraC-like DNA-binding protein